MLRPKRSHKSELQTPGLPDLRQHMMQYAERREGIRLQTVPRLHHGVRARRLRIRNRSEVNQETSIQGRREQVDVCRPATMQLPKRLMTKGLFRAKDLGAATEGVSKDVQVTGNKLRNQANLIVLAKTKNRLGQGVQS